MLLMTPMAEQNIYFFYLHYIQARNYPVKGRSLPHTYPSHCHMILGAKEFHGYYTIHGLLLKTRTKMITIKLYFKSLKHNARRNKILQSIIVFQEWVLSFSFPVLKEIQMCMLLISTIENYLLTIMQYAESWYCGKMVHRI